MNRLLILPVLLLTLLVGNPAFSADFQKGLTAYESGDYATALREWKPLAENKGFRSLFYPKKEVMIAQHYLGVMYDEGQGVPQDYKTAVKWFTLAAEQGDAFAQRDLGLMYARGEGVPQDNIYAHMWYNIAAISGKSKNASKNRDNIAKQMTPSQLETAQKLARECISKKYKGCESAGHQKVLTVAQSGDYATALREWTPLAKQGDVVAQTGLGLMYAKGKGVPQNYKTAVKWYKLAAEQGYADAQYNLGVMYDNGWGVPQDNVDSYMWYNLAASSGNKGAVTKGDIVAKRMTPADITSAQNLALLMQIDPNFQNGVTASQRGDFATNLREWTPLAEQGDADAQFNLGVMYNQGQGVPQDNKTAVKWYKLAAEQGHASAQHYLGVMYHEGQGVPQDNKTAVKWYKLAAEQGDADAQLNLGVMYAAPKDYVYAHMWGEIAASNGNKLGAMLRDDFEKKMTPSQISEAQQLARECVRKKYKGC